MSARRVRPELTRRQAETVAKVLDMVTNDPDLWGPGCYFSSHEARAVEAARSALHAALNPTEKGR